MNKNEMVIPLHRHQQVPEIALMMLSCHSSHAVNTQEQELGEEWGQTSSSGGLINFLTLDPLSGLQAEHVQMRSVKGVLERLWQKNFIWRKK